MENVRGKVVGITGAGSGIEETIAVLLATKGARRNDQLGPLAGRTM